MSKHACVIDNCGRPVQARGWCSAHYQRWHKHGDPNHGAALPPYGRGPCAVEHCCAPRGETFAVANAAKTHCKWGHALTPENSYGYNGRRQCKMCARNRARGLRPTGEPR